MFQNLTTSLFLGVDGNDDAPLSGSLFCGDENLANGGTDCEEKWKNTIRKNTGRVSVESDHFVVSGNDDSVEGSGNGIALEGSGIWE